MLSGKPRITHHAFTRAFERLGITGHAFDQWVKATYRDWLEVDAEFVRDRGLTVTREFTEHYVCPWTPRSGVALAVSRDGWIKTVMLFEQKTPVGVPELKPTSAGA